MPCRWLEPYVRFKNGCKVYKIKTPTQPFEANSIIYIKWVVVVTEISFGHRCSVVCICKQLPTFSFLFPVCVYFCTHMMLSYMERLWGASSHLWQSLWTQLYHDVAGGNEFALYMGKKCMYSICNLVFEHCVWNVAPLCKITKAWKPSSITSIL